MDAGFPKTPSPKPARIPPQTPPAGGKSAEVLPNPFPQKNCFGKTETILVFRVLRKMGSDFFKQTPPDRKLQARDSRLASLGDQIIRFLERKNQLAILHFGKRKFLVIFFGRGKNILIT